MNPNNSVIFQYVHNRRRQKVGVVLAKKLHNGSVSIGWSLCNPKDAFKKSHALSIAEGRADNISDSPLPHSLLTDYQIILDRAHRYFKGDEIIG